MSNRRNTYRFNSTPIILPNTFIGGVGSTYVTSAADYAALSNNLAESDVENFQNDGLNVSFYIGIPYTFNSNTFFNQSNVTYFIDPEGLSDPVLTNVFRTLPNLLYFYNPNFNLSNSTGARFFNNLTTLKGTVYNLSTAIGHDILTNFTSLKKAIFPNATTAYQGVRTSLRNLTSIERLYIPLVTRLHERQGYIQTLININPSAKIYCSPVLQTSSKAQNVVRIVSNLLQDGETVTINGLVYTCTSNVTNPGDFFNHPTDDRNTAASLRSVINADTRNGTIATTITAYNQNNTREIYLESDLGVSGNSITVSVNAPSGGMTVDNPTFQFGDGEDATIRYARDRGCDIIYVDNVISVDTPTLNSAIKGDGNLVQINFDEITPNANGTDGYEVWIDDGSVYRKWFDFDEIENSGDVIDLTDVINDGFNITGSTVTIRAFDGQLNFSEFSNEVVITSGVF
jgi:hypothetical protein